MASDIGLGLLVAAPLSKACLAVALFAAAWILKRSSLAFCVYTIIGRSGWLRLAGVVTKSAAAEATACRNQDCKMPGLHSFSLL